MSRVTSWKRAIVTYELDYFLLRGQERRNDRHCDEMNEQVSKAGESLELASAENDGVEMKGNTFQI